MNNKDNRKLVMIAFYSALYVVVDFTIGHLMTGEFAHVFPKLILVIASYHLGYKKGFYVAMITVVLDFAMGHAHLEAGIWGILLDYIIVYGSYGLSSIIPNYKGLPVGILAMHALGLIASTISRMIAFDFGLKAALVLVLPSVLLSALLGLILIPQIIKRLKLIDYKN